MAHPNEQLLRTLYGAFSSKDIEAVRSLLADDVVFHQPGRNPLSGDYKGVDSVLGLVRKLGERSGGTFQVDVHDVLASAAHSIALLRVSGTREGRVLDVHAVHVFHIRGGKIAEVWVHPEDQYAVDEFWA